MDAVERREAIALSGSPIRRVRDVQRIEQGMGRGVRESSDQCAVLLLGANLAIATQDPRWLDLFSPATRAQLKLSWSVANQIKGKGLDAVRTVLALCLDRDAKWVASGSRALAEVRYDEFGVVRPEAVAGRKAFDLAAAGQTAEAVKKTQAAINDLEDDQLRGWFDGTKSRVLALHRCGRSSEAAFSGSQS